MIEIGVEHDGSSGGDFYGIVKDFEMLRNLPQFGPALPVTEVPPAP